MAAKKEHPKDVVVAVRLSRREVAVVDAQRGALTRSEWLRWLLTKGSRPTSP